MRRKFSILLALLLSVAGISGYSQRFEGGVTAGMITSQINGDGYGGYHQLGWTGGVFGRIPTEGPSAWQLEVRYSLFGARASVDEIEFGYNPMDIRLHYIEMPITYRYNLGRFQVGELPLDFLTLEIGLSADFLAKNFQSANFDSGFENPNWLFFSFTGNIGLQFELSDRLGINVRSMNSLTPCRWNLQSASIFYGHYYNIVLQAGLTYTILAPGK